MQLEIIVPGLIACMMLWWVSRGMSWTRLLAVTAVTLALIAVILWVERSGF